MTATTYSSETDLVTPATGRAAWTRVLAWSAGLVAAVDIVFFALIGEVIPPLAVGMMLTVTGLLLLRKRPSIAVGILGVVSVLMLFGSAPFAVDHLPHPESGIDWVHSVVGVAGRLVAIAAALLVWRGGSEQSARRTGVAALGLLGLIVVVAALATMGTSGEAAEPGDVIVEVHEAAFPDEIVVNAGDVAYLDNADMFRHTFTVEGTAINAEIPALQGVRVPIDVTPGEYALICAVPGHEFMTATLTVR